MQRTSHPATTRETSHIRTESTAPSFLSFVARATNHRENDHAASPAMKSRSRLPVRQAQSLPNEYQLRSYIHRALSAVSISALEHKANRRQKARLRQISSLSSTFCENCFVLDDNIRIPASPSAFLTLSLPKYARNLLLFDFHWKGEIHALFHSAEPVRALRPYIWRYSQSLRSPGRQTNPAALTRNLSATHRDQHHRLCRQHH